MPGYVDPLHDFFHSTWKFCISLKEWTCSSILRHCTVLIGTPFGICISKFVPEEIGTPFGICISKFVPEEASHFSVSMDTIDILSSSSEDEIEVRCIGETPFQKEAVASSIDSAGRKLLSWASTSSSNSIYASKPSQDLCLRTTMPAFNSRNKDRISNEREKAQLGSEYGSLAAPPDEVKRQLYFMSTSDEKASNHHTSNLTLYSNPVSEVDGKSLSQNTPRILPNTLQRPMPTSESKFDRKSLSQNTPRILPSTFQQAMSASESKVDGKSLSQNTPRILPNTLQPPMPTSESKASMGSGGYVSIHDFHGDTNHPVGANAADRKTYTQDSGVEKVDGKSLSQNTPRILPNTLHQPMSTSESKVNGKSLSQNTPRILPNTLQRPMSTSESKASMGSGGYVPIHGFHGDTYHPVGANAADRKTYTKDSGVEKDGAIIYEKRRLLPPTLMHGKAVTDSQPVSMNAATLRSGVGEERPMENDERLIFQAALQDLAQPKLEANLPEGILTVTLLRHQKIALAWMLQKETASLHCLGGILADDQGLGKTISMIALIQMQKSLQSKSTSDSLRHIKSAALNLVEDDDNVSDLEIIKQTEKPDDLERMPVASTSIPLFHKGRPAAGTLVVCPASVLRQWARELNEKVTESAKLSVLVYHGSTRTKDPVELAKYDVVLTTYSIVSNEVPKLPLVDDDDEEQRNMEKYAISSDFSTNKKRKKITNAVNKKKNRKGNGGSSLDYDSGPLARVGWFRVILDEAQTIKNYRTQVARACCGLRAKRRWCLSGTPIQNSIDDLYSYFRFLKYDPYAVYKSFCSTIKYQISRNASTGYKKLQAVLKTVMLRRTKGTVINGEPIIELPPKSICLKKVDFSPEERAFYSMLEADSRKQFKAYAAAGTVKQNYANILLMLLRLRQACDHPLLVKGYHSDSVVKASLDMARKLPREMLINLLNHLEASLAICGVCSDPPEDAVVTMCGHVFCYQCVSEHLTGDDNFCPAVDCKDLLGPDVIFSRATLQSCISDELDNNKASSSSEITTEPTAEQNLCTSSKIKAALEILNSLCRSSNPNSKVTSEGCDFCQKRTCHCISQFCSSDVLAKTDTCDYNLQPQLPEKAIIFSQWTSMLDLLEISLNHSLIQYRRLDGTMSLASRDRAVKDFTTDPEVTVMIMSLKAGNLGLNMVAASHVILLDLWWNPTTEDQAIDRAHRIGQTRPVTVSRLTIKDTVEDRILALQEEKRKMVSSAFGEDQSGGTFATRLTVEDLRYLFMV